MPDSRSTASRSSTPPPLLAAALVLFAIGVLAIVVMFAVLIFSDSAPGLWLYLTAMLCPVGFLLAIAFALRSGRRARS